MTGLELVTAQAQTMGTAGERDPARDQARAQAPVRAQGMVRARAMVHPLVQAMVQAMAQAMAQDRIQVLVQAMARRTDPEMATVTAMPPLAVSTIASTVPRLPWPSVLLEWPSPS